MRGTSWGGITWRPVSGSKITAGKGSKNSVEINSFIKERVNNRLAVWPPPLAYYGAFVESNLHEEFTRRTQRSHAITQSPVDDFFLTRSKPLLKTRVTCHPSPHPKSADHFINAPFQGILRVISRTGQLGGCKGRKIGWNQDRSANEIIHEL